MAYIGKRPEDTFRGLATKASFTGDGSTTTFDLSENALDGGTNDIQVFVNNVRQEPGSGKSYTLGTDDSDRIRRITFTVAPAASDDIYVISPGRDSNELNTVSDNAITTAKIQDGAITAAKIADGTVVAADIADGAITGAKVNSTFDISAKTVTLPASVGGLGTGITNAQLAGSIANAKLANSSVTINGTSIALGASGEISAGTSWQAVKTSDFTAAAGEGYFVNTTSGAITVTLPGSASIGDEVSIIDYAGTADTNNITIGRNSHKIQGDSSDLTVSTERAGFTLVYVDATQGWLLKDK
tara:strand:- start:527 stop:1426 length:900 start_codon:yes stop_codon:yes gene_type:complete